jgi:hypothetical protein
MPSLYELAEKGKEIKKDRELKQKAEEERLHKKEIRSYWKGAYRRSNAAGNILYLGILGVSWGIIMPLIDITNFLSLKANMGVLLLGFFIILSSVIMVYFKIKSVKVWKLAIPFKIPENYLYFISTTFSTFSKWSGRSYNEIGIEIEFEYPFDQELTTSAVLGLNRKGVTVCCQAQTDRLVIDELNHPETEPLPPEDDEAYFNTPDEPDSVKRKRESIKVIKITGNRFISGNGFHRFFKRLCEEILIPLHKECTVINISLTNSGVNHLMGV